ncbi:hypothetical protein Lgra_1257 [Legionella gratiana]|uniref:Uncharacterized protein n=1 Tax=Legionella gratiana TaxID=45066 RepID=A0A378J1C9_9GAMM|nr:hypothetical protein [Legionella gratiana]KTD11799.1 hypothetical protein Lgra_1257 [Legionella gratiana]STX40727.1 Uncharacterised protein [Legionella gratiana]
MKREKLIEFLVHQFAENIKNAPDQTLKDIKSGKLVISLTPSLDKESGGRIAAYSKTRLL